MGGEFLESKIPLHSAKSASPIGDRAKYLRRGAMQILFVHHLKRNDFVVDNLFSLQMLLPRFCDLGILEILK